MRFAFPIVWREQSDHATDCHFCMTNIRAFSRKPKPKISYPMYNSAIKPISHEPDLPVAQPPTKNADILFVDEPASIGTESEEDLIESNPLFQHESAALFINQERPNDLVRDLYLSAPINSHLNVAVRSPTPFGLGQNDCWPSRGSQLPRALPYIFSLCCPLNDRRRAAHSIYKFGRLFSLFLLSCLTLALYRLLILLLMSGNVHPNPGPIFPCSVCAGNVTRRRKSVLCCTCSKWVHLRCSQLSLSEFRALGSSHSWSCPPLSQH